MGNLFAAPNLQQFFLIEKRNAEDSKRVSRDLSFTTSANRTSYSTMGVSKFDCLPEATHARVVSLLLVAHFKIAEIYWGWPVHESMKSDICIASYLDLIEFPTWTII